MTILP